MSPITVAIAGSTGNIGPYVAKAFLSPIHPISVNRVLILTRDPSSPKAKELEGLGGQIVKLEGDAPKVEQLKGVDVLINCLSHSVPLETKDSYVQAAAEAGVKVYFPSEFGIDHRRNDFEHPVWDGKKAHADKARATGKLKVISLYTGHFLETAIGPWFGFDTKNHVYTAVGSPTAKFSTTSKVDVGYALAQLSVRAVENPSEVPDHVRISGDAKSFQEIAEIMGRESGVEIKVETIDVTEWKEKIHKEGKAKGDPLVHLRLLNGSGNVDFTKENDNQLVNPGLWKWKTVEDYAKETKGKPWSD